MEESRLKVCVVGAAGYAGAELCRYGVGHPAMDLAMATARAEAQRPLADLYPALRGATNLALSKPDPQVIAAQCDLAFLAVPHTAALKLAPALLEQGVSVIDLSADYRLKDPQVYEAWYETPHSSPELLAKAAYGLPELRREELNTLRRKHAQGEPVLVAVPGCYPTACALAAAPALAAGVVRRYPVIADAISGVSGAGRSANARTHFCHADESVEAYGVTNHRHTPEIEQSLSFAAGEPVAVVFTPHLGPYKRGILATCYLSISPAVSLETVYELYAKSYAGDPLVEVLELGCQPTTAAVCGSAKASLGLALDGRTSTLIVTCALDNLGKGAAAQAIQCANIVCGLPEETGLLQSLPPVV